MSSREDGTRERILKAAGEIFAEHGFKSATVREICQQASVNLASVNYHFGDKENLYRETILLAYEASNEVAPMPEWSSGTPAEIKFREMIFVLLQRMLQNDSQPWQSRLLIREHFQPSGVCQEIIEEHIRPQHALMTGIIKELIPQETSAWKLQHYTFSVVGQCLFYRIGEPIMRMMVPEASLPDHDQIPELSKHIADVMLSSFQIDRERSAAAV